MHVVVTEEVQSSNDSLDQKLCNAKAYTVPDNVVSQPTMTDAVCRSRHGIFLLCLFHYESSATRQHPRAVMSRHFFMFQHVRLTLESLLAEVLVLKHSAEVREVHQCVVPSHHVGKVFPEFRVKQLRRHNEQNLPK